MADQLQNTSNVDTNSTSKPALVTDLNSSYVGTEQYSHARNAVRNSKEGDIGTIGNEPSNEFCFKTLFKIVGHVILPDDRVMIFSTDEVHSEIGIGTLSTCTYAPILNMDCLGFSKNNPISGEAKEDFQRGIVVYFTDNLNPIRRIELKKIDKIETCDDTLLFKNVDYPCIEVQRGYLGNMPNGTYSVAIAYVINDQIFSDWYAITNRVTLFSDTRSNSLEVKLSNLDKEFDQFALLVVGTYIDPSTGGVTKLAKNMGTYSTKLKSLSITDFTNTTSNAVQLSDLLLQRKTWVKAGLITSNANYLLIADLTSRPEEDYQLKAMTIEAEYVVEQVPANYYELDGVDVSFYRDENYDFYIQGVYKTGELTDKFHIGGRKSTEEDRSPVSSTDVYEFDNQFLDCTPDKTIPRWKVQNTAGQMIPYNNPFSCGRRVLGRGTMGYFESTDFYPDNAATFGDDTNTPIRYHKMPDECVISRYTIIEGVTYINILGVRFKNIPAFDNPDIIGYKITRSDRKGGNGTVVARGLMTNVRSYHDSVFDETIMYSNYPVNDLSPDQFISSKQTVYRDGSEHNFTPLTDYHKDRFTFYSPHTSFEPRYSLGTEVKIECEEIADVTGQFDLVYKHPKEKLMNQFAFWLAASVGILEAALVLIGNSDIRSTSGVKIGVTDAGPYYELSTRTKINGVDDLLKLSAGQLVQLTIDAVKTLDPTKIGTIVNLITAIFESISGLILKPAYAALQGLKEANDIFQIIQDLTGYTDYVYQYNASANFNRSICVGDGNKRRRLLKPATYLPSTIVNVDGTSDIFNNLFGEKSVYLQLNKPIADPKVADTTRKTAAGFDVCGDITAKTKSIGSAFYATSKVINPNQYGALGSSSPVSMHSCLLQFEIDPETNLTNSPILYGGDCVITRFQFQKRRQFFSQNIAGTNFTPGTEYDYRKYRNIGFPRFWADFTKYDFSEIVSGNVVNFSKFSRTTTSKHNLDCKGHDGGSPTRIDDAYMYLSNNSALDFFVEADYNVDFREKQINALPYYSKKNKDLNEIFRQDRLDQPEEFNISRAFSDLYTTEIFAPQQRHDFDPENPLPTSQPNSVIYSLPSFNLQQVDNWQYFLPANYFAFRESDFGRLTGVHKLDQDRIIFLFSQASPFVSMGRSLLQLNNQTVTVGDGGLFAQDPREIMPTDNNYGSCNSRFAFSNTHMGRFYPSESQGRILNFTESLDDITRAGISYWCKNYMPIALYNYFPTFPQEENPIAGVGYLTVFDSFYETVYITKRDFSPKRELVKDMVYDDQGGVFRYKNEIIQLRDPKYFNDISWTLSYSPLDKSFVSWHDWHPDWVIQRDNHFLTVKDNVVYKHNESFESFCNFYGADYPFEIEFVSNSGQQIEIARSIEYILEVYKYKNFGRDRFHVHHQNFDRLIVRNTEQISPLLDLTYASPDPEYNLQFPRVNPSTAVTYDILFSKEENKYRINQFWDCAKDRGEFDSNEFHLFPTDESGYKQIINPVAVDMNKPEEQRKKFRHYWNKFRLIKTISGANKFIAKLYNIKKLISPR